MELSLSQLSLLVELTEVELAEMKKITDAPSSTEEEADDAGEHSMQMLALASALQALYKEKWSASDEEKNYEELIKDIHSRRL